MLALCLEMFADVHFMRDIYSFKNIKITPLKFKSRLLKLLSLFKRINTIPVSIIHSE